MSGNLLMNCFFLIHKYCVIFYNRAGDDVWRLIICSYYIYEKETLKVSLNIQFQIIFLQYITKPETFHPSYENILLVVIDRLVRQETPTC